MIDHEGQLVFDETGHERFHFMARNLAITSQIPRNIRIRIGSSSILEVIPCETPHGRIVLGTTVAEPMPPSHVKTIMEALIQTAAPV